MTPNRNRRVILLALVLAAAAALLAYLLIASRPALAPTIVEVSPESGEPVLVSARFIPEGTTLAANDVAVAYVAPESRGDRALTESAQAVGNVALIDFPEGEQILAGSVGDATDLTLETFARDVPVGMRAVSIASAETVGVGGFVQPGDRVDVVAAMELELVPAATPTADVVGLNVKEGESIDIAELILQDVQVLAVGQAIGATASAPPAASDADSTSAEGEETGPTSRPEATSVTLLVTPTQALRLALAEQGGSVFRLLLRAPGDTSVTDLPPALITAGTAPLAPFELVGSNLIAEDLVVTSARFGDASVPAGGILEFEATVRNVSSRFIPAGQGGAPPGHVYAAGETWQSLDELLLPGVYSLGVTTEGMAPQTYPWRWDLGEDLAPGQSVTVTGGIQAPNSPGVQRWWFGTLLQPGTIVEDGVAPMAITIEPATSVVVLDDEVSLQESPWNSAPVVATFTLSTELAVLDYQDGWFRVRSGGSEGWVRETSVVNTALPQAAAAEDAA
jgi:pilus assembly protein CpaB